MLIDFFSLDIGWKNNKPICQTGDDVEEVIGPYVYESLQRDLEPGERLDSSSLCAHQLYGGRSRGNLGAVCKNPNGRVSSKRILSIEDIRKAPQFTNDYYPPSLYRYVYVQALETYCRAACYCSGEDEDTIKQRVQVWNAMATGIKEAGTELNDGKLCI